jgi:hypothetical protein
MTGIHTPVLFIIFNRPDTTARVFAEIKKAKPSVLFIAADGPRKDKPGEAERIKQTREIVANIDWKCTVKTRFLDENLGCRNAVSSAINWFFDEVEMGIILEDDCLPSESFFYYCQEVLEKYKDDDRVFHVNGSNYQMGWKRDPDYPYYFSRYNSIWGWASWRRAWKHYDIDIETWPEVKEKKYFLDFSFNKMDAVAKHDIFEMMYRKKLDTWDYQWSYAILSNSGISIIPNTNLISNIGFGEQGTHTTKLIKRAALPTGQLNFPLNHPPFMIVDKESDLRQFNLHGKRGYIWRLKNWRRLLFS